MAILILLVLWPVSLGGLSMQTLLAPNVNWKWTFFLFNVSPHYHVYILSVFPLVETISLKNVDYMMLIYLHCGVKHKVYPDHPSYERWSSESKAWRRFKLCVSWWRRNWLFSYPIKFDTSSHMQSMTTYFFPTQQHSFCNKRNFFCGFRNQALKLWSSQLWT